MMKTIQDQINEPDGLRRYLVPWGIYIDGAQAMLLKLRKEYLLEEYRGKSGKRHDAVRHARGDEFIYNKAIVDLLLSSKEETDCFLTDSYRDIRFTDFERDKKGKLIKCRAFFAGRVTIKKETQ